MAQVHRAGTAQTDSHVPAGNQQRGKLPPAKRIFQDGQPKQYVQDLVFGHGSLIHRLWGQEEGSLYVCGKVAMASGVQVYKPL